MSGKRATTQFNKNHFRDRWSIPAWFIEQQERSANPNRPRPKKRKKS